MPDDTETSKKALAAKTIALPAVSQVAPVNLGKLTEALHVPRSVLAADDQIEQAWSQLPRLISRIPIHLRDERIVKMCVAVASGLFDAAINYTWNAAVIELREKIRRFGINVVPQIVDNRDFDEQKLLELRDADLLDLCLKLNLIGRDDFFFLDHCRATRNSFSAAHPADGNIDEDEFVIFLSRCQKHALTSESHPRGVDIKAMLTAIKGGRFTQDQHGEWSRRFNETFDAQRELIFTTLHGIYCDANSDESARNNALLLCKQCSEHFSPKVRSALLDRHQDYKAKGDDQRNKASAQFFEELNLLGILNTSEVHSIFTVASKNLLGVHNAMNNFYNEPPFADRLYTLSKNTNVPTTAQDIFVEAVITPAVGNFYGVSNAAMPYYKAMISSFSPNEIKIMLEIVEEDTLLSNRIKRSSKCSAKYRELVKLINGESVPRTAQRKYHRWIEDEEF